MGAWWGRGCKWPARRGDSGGEISLQLSQIPKDTSEKKLLHATGQRLKRSRALFFEGGDGGDRLFSLDTSKLG